MPSTSFLRWMPVWVMKMGHKNELKEIDVKKCVLFFWWCNYRYLFCWFFIRQKNIWKYFSLWRFFFFLLFGSPTANFEPLSRRQPHSPNVNHLHLHIQPEGHWQPRNKVGSLSLAKRLVGFEPETFQFWPQRLNPLGHSSYKASTIPKPLHIRFDEIDGFIRTHGYKFRHLVLFDHGLFDKICDKIKYLIIESDITDSIDHNFKEIIIDS